MERSVTSDGKFYRLPPDKDNTVIVSCFMELEEVVFKKLEELLGNFEIQNLDLAKECKISK